MRIALLIPCHNAARFLPELFEGVRAQTVPFDEIICYDDASQDDTSAVAEGLGARVLKGSVNEGAAFARNRLIEACTCEWAHFHDADDLIDARFVENLSMFARREASPVLCSMRVVEREGRREVALTRFTALGESADQAAWLIENTAYAIIGLYPLDLLRRSGGFDERLRGNEDPDFHIRLAFAGAHFQICEDALVTNLTRSDSFSSRNWQRCFEDRLKCLLTYAERRLTQPQELALGRDAVRIAYEFYCFGLYQEMDTALALARARGVREVASSQAGVRLLSRLLGPRLFFRLRKFARKERG